MRRAGIDAMMKNAARMTREKEREESEGVSFLSFHSFRHFSSHCFYPFIVHSRLLFCCFSLRLLMCVCAYVRVCAWMSTLCRTLPCLWSFPFATFSIVPVVHDSNGPLVFIFVILLCLLVLSPCYPSRSFSLSPPCLSSFSSSSSFFISSLHPIYPSIHCMPLPSSLVFHRVCLVIVYPSIHPSVFFLYSGSRQAFLVSMGSSVFLFSLCVCSSNSPD